MRLIFRLRTASADLRRQGMSRGSRYELLCDEGE